MNRICPFCEKVVGNDPHIYGCKNKTTTDKKEIKFLFISKNFPSLNKKTLEDCYVIKLMSLPDIKKIYNIDYKSIIFLLDYFNIEKRNNSQSAILISKNKYENTCREKYGVNNVSKLKEIKNKKKETFMKNYGVDNIFKDEEFKKWILENNFAWNNLTKEQNEDRIKKQANSIKKYWHRMTDEYKTGVLYKYDFSSKLETKITEALTQLNISYETPFPHKGKIFDIRIKNSNILIEVNGDYWHCNPTKYKEDDFVNFPYKPKTKVIDVWNKDKNKKELAEKSGYKVIYLWENDINKSNNLVEFVYNSIFRLV